ncbi:MAG: hypothetical protein KC550_04310, partial [Nanoarchaeota archaeon]|nr:hypothetical protein [Nanoarchaeota archaeon]
MYRVIKCPNCKYLQLSSALKTFKCVKCQKSKDVNRVKVYFESRTPQEAVQVLQELKKQFFIVKNEENRE